VRILAVSVQESSKSSGKTVTRSFRISEPAFTALEEGAARHRVSLNTLVNQMFLSYADVDRFFERVGYVKVPKSAFRRVLEHVPENDLAEAAQQSAEGSGKAIILAKYGTLSLFTVLDFIRTFVGYTSFAEYSEVLNPEKKRVITLMHNDGMKVSIYLSQSLIAFFKMIDIRPKITLTDDAVVLEV
jgi:hypothetical protein